MKVGLWCLLIVACSGCGHEGVDAAFIAREEPAVLEAIFRHFCNDPSWTYYLSFSPAERAAGIDVSDEVLTRLTQAPRTVDESHRAGASNSSFKRGSEAGSSGSGPYAMVCDKKTGERGTVCHVTIEIWMSESMVGFRVDLLSGALASETYRGDLRKEDGKWEIVRSSIELISRS